MSEQSKPAMSHYVTSMVGTQQKYNITILRKLLIVNVSKHYNVLKSHNEAAASIEQRTRLEETEGSFGRR